MVTLKEKDQHSDKHGDTQRRKKKISTVINMVILKGERKRSAQWSTWWRLVHVTLTGKDKKKIITLINMVTLNGERQTRSAQQSTWCHSKVKDQNKKNKKKFITLINMEMLTGLGKDKGDEQSDELTMCHWPSGCPCQLGHTRAAGSGLCTSVSGQWRWSTS